jgi:hypothetical protein
VRLKALFLFAREEGLPAREDWLVSLSADERATAEAVLRSQPEDVVTLPEGADVPALVTSITRWMCGDYHIVEPKPVK